MPESSLRGVIAAVATPIDPSGSPDTARATRRARDLLDNGCDGLNVLGTTGEATFRSALERAKERGELPPKADVDALARFLTAGIQGLRLVGKVNPDRAILEDIASTMLRCLESQGVRNSRRKMI